MSPDHASFGRALAMALVRREERIQPDPDNAAHVRVKEPAGGSVALDLTPFAGHGMEPTARPLFAPVRERDGLLVAYDQARQSIGFETDDPAAMAAVSASAEEFLREVMARAQRELRDDEAVRIARWVSDLDLYAAVKSVESLVNSPADRALLSLADECGWAVLFDHVAIRCGTEERGDGRRIARLLCEGHGYVASQLPPEQTYRFADGWNAYPLYKLLTNGQVLRIFLDESATGHPVQIIQHWNRVYGYTAHHLALRCTRRRGREREAVPLHEVVAALADRGVDTMEPTGGYSEGLLEQVFTQPTRNAEVSVEVKAQLATHGAGLEQTIENAKLIELVSRREMGSLLARQLFALYGVEYDPADPLHSAPCYTYFLPAQAAHVIATSIAVA
ncbi:MAG TPA: hypothetical protein VGB12_13525 [bacterium]